MIEWLREDEKRLMITFSHEEENRLKRLYPDLSNRILDWESYRTRYQPATSHIKEVGIDNADMILQNMSDKIIGKITMNYVEIDDLKK